MAWNLLFEILVFFSIDDYIFSSSFIIKYFSTYYDTVWKWLKCFYIHWLMHTSWFSIVDKKEQILFESQNIIVK